MAMPTRLGYGRGTVVSALYSWGGDGRPFPHRSRVGDVGSRHDLARVFLLQRYKLRTLRAASQAQL